MVYEAQPAFIYHGTWDDTTRTHPAMNFMEIYTKGVIDQRNWSCDMEEWHTKDFSFMRADGTRYDEGGESAWKAVQENYAVFTENLHDPHFIVCYEAENGWEMVGAANLYVNLVGPPCEDPKVTDKHGKTWDVSVPASFHFYYEKDESSKHGVLLSRTEIASDTFPIMQGLMKRGVIPSS